MKITSRMHNTNVVSAKIHLGSICPLKRALFRIELKEKDGIIRYYKLVKKHERLYFSLS